MEVLKVDFQDPDAPEIFTRSLRETGFGVLQNHPINKELVDKVYADWQVFFASEMKYDYLSEETHDGFFPTETAEVAKGCEIKDIKEFYHFYPWGRSPTLIGPETLELFMQMSALAGTLLRWVEEYTPPEIAKYYSMPLSDMITDCRRTMLRVIHYPPFDGSEAKGAVRAAAHGDINLLTLLPAATQSGLQVQDVDGGWHDVQCDFGSIAINTADMLEAVSQNYFPSTIHHVINPGEGVANVSRLSLPLFLHARPEVRISEKYTADEFWQERMRELGLLTT